VEKEPSSSPSLDMGLLLAALHHFLESQKNVSRSNKVIHNEGVAKKGLDNVAFNVEDERTRREAIFDLAMRPETASAAPMSIKMDEEDDLTKQEPAADNWAVNSTEDEPK
jgi:hypothetical protein